MAGGGYGARQWKGADRLGDGFHPKDGGLAEAARKHWGLENSRLWVLEVTMREDQSRIRRDHAPGNLTRRRHIAPDLITAAQLPKSSLRRRIKKAGGDSSFLEAILAS